MDAKAHPAITPEIVAEHGLKPDEYQRLLKILGRRAHSHGIELK